MRLIADGVVERDGVEGLATRLGYSSRHLTRLLDPELGAGPLALARAQRAQNARVLIETRAGARRRRLRRGLRQRPAVQRHIREVYSATPSELRRLRTPASRERRCPAVSADGVDVRIPVRRRSTPGAMAFLARHLVPGVEAAGPGWYARSLRLPHGSGAVRLDLAGRRPRPGPPRAGCT